MNLSLQTKENVLFPDRNWHKYAISKDKKKSDGEQEKSGSDGEGERGQIIPNFSCVCL